MNIIADTHTHTLASDHAYSTITENAMAAAAKGIEFLCYTEHSVALTGAPSLLHHGNLKTLPRYLHEVMILRGVESNILDYKGKLDVPDFIMKNLEWRIASMHTFVVEPSTIKDHTAGWIAIAQNPLVDVIGHCGDGRYAFEHRPVLEAFKAYGKIVEINNHSFAAREGSAINCQKIAELCGELEIPIVISSDAHFHDAVGVVSEAVAMLKEIDFPEKLIINADSERFRSTVHKINGGPLIGELA